MKEVAMTPVLEAKASIGAGKFWKCRVETDGSGYFLVSESWITTASGEESKHLVSAPAQVLGKNQGKANETSDKEQAIFDMGVKQRKKLDKGYHVQGQEDVREFKLPMLAHKFHEKEHTVKYPVLVQPKYNGIRCLYDGKKFWSRGGKELIHEVTEHLHFDTQGYTVDGELMLPREFTFQESIKAIKKLGPNTKKLVYHVYDIMDESMSQQERLDKKWDVMRSIKGSASHQNVQHHPASSKADIVKFHDECVVAGYEGAIVRFLDGKYTPGQRNGGLLKFKVMHDGEYKIVGFEDGEGSAKGAIIFVCVTPEGKEFRVTPEGSMEDRHDMYKAGKTLIGKMLTVRYQALSDEGKPYICTGVAVRDYEGKA